MKKEEVQQEYLKLQVLDGQIQELQKQLETMEEQNFQLLNLKENIGSVKSFKKNSKIHAPISPGIYLESELKNTEEVLVNTGSNIFVKKTLKDAQELVQKRIDQVKKIIEDLTLDLQDLSNQAKESQEKLKEYV